MDKTIWESHLWRKDEEVNCDGKVFKVHSVNFESGMIGIHNDTEVHEVHYSKIEI